MKRIHQNSLIGDRGIALIHTLVGQMGFVWNPRSLEAGIDGEIELRDDITGEVKNCIIFVQSKAVERHFANETEDGFDFYCDERDIEYWLSGNGPVILVCSRPSSSEAYWIDVRRHFSDLARRASKKATFDKHRDRFDQTARRALIALAEPDDSGLYLAPRARREKLISNLVPLQVNTSTLFTAQCYADSVAAVDSASARTFDSGPAWTLEDGQLISFIDLNHPTLGNLVERGTIEEHPLEEWSLSDDEATSRLYVQLLNRALRAHLQRFDIGFNFHREYYYFAPNNGLKTRDWQYRASKEQAVRAVFRRYVSKHNVTQYCRHCAFFGQFSRVEEQWYLAIEPTYRFTSDGVHFHPQTPKLLKKIKILERNLSVLGQVYMWADVLARTDGMFTTSELFTFGNLISFDVQIGVPDEEWLAHEEDETAVLDRGGLFD